MKNRYLIFILLVAGILAIFVVRAVLSMSNKVPYTFHLFDVLTILGVLIVLWREYRDLRWGDWLTALVLGTVIGVGMVFATLFSPYPFLGIVRDSVGQALIRGGFTMIATLGGLVIMRQGGPVHFHATNGDWQKTIGGILIGLGVGLPFAVLNVFALQVTQGQSMEWQNPLAALLDALQPGVVEEVIFRFALWGLLWKWLQKSIPDRAVWLAGALSMLVHNYSHFDDLFVQAPLTALGMGAVLALIWGLPSLILAHRQGLESAITFHWLQDVARFLIGY